MIQPLLVFSDWGILALRLALGAILIVHGWPKIKNLKATAEWLGQTFKPGLFWAIVVALTEFVGGLFLVFGFLTQIVSFFLVIEFLVIIFKVKRGKPLVDGFEFDLLILAAALILLTLGSGLVSLDNYLGIILY